MSDLNDDASFDPETISNLAGVLDRVWRALSPEHQATITRANIAEYILTLATHGERNVTRLLDSALAHFTGLQK